MTPERFNRIVEHRLKFCANLLVPKGKEYSRNGDRLWNFKIAAKLSPTRETPERALWGMYRKHLVSLMDMIDDVERGKLPTDQAFDDKISDTINYALLLEGLLRERIDQHEEEVA